MSGMRQEQDCPWCHATDNLVPMKQGGLIHTACPICGSNGPLVASELRKTYIRLRGILEFAEEGAKIFVNKVETGQARSRVTYQWCKELLSKIEEILLCSTQ